MRDVYRSAPTFQVRAAEDGDAGVTLFGHFSRFNEWTRIDSFWEGTFMERIAPGAFKKTFGERTPKVLFQHGRDPEVGNKPIAAVNELREDKDGAYYEASLFDGLPALIESGLRAGQYGASFGFEILQQNVDKEPKRSGDNPDGLPEHTITEVRLHEFGPVTFPAYESATAGVRSLTDDLVLDRLAREQPDRLHEFIAAHRLEEPNVEQPEEDEPDTESTRFWALARQRHALMGRRWSEPGATHSI